jgi:hypothetical protein
VERALRSIPASFEVNRTETPQSRVNPVRGDVRALEALSDRSWADTLFRRLHPADVYCVNVEEARVKGS